MEDEVKGSYELIYIVPTSYTEEELGTVEGHVADLLTKFNATISETKRVGKMRFAYPMKHESFGHYVLVYFTAEKSELKHIEEGMRLNQKEILRYMIVDMDDLGNNTYELVQFQPVSADAHDKRRRSMKTEKPKTEDKEKEKQEQKEGVEALEGTTEEKESTDVEAMSSEDLEKKIDEALDEKSA